MRPEVYRVLLLLGLASVYSPSVATPVIPTAVIPAAVGAPAAAAATVGTSAAGKQVVKGNSDVHYLFLLTF